MLYIPMFLDSFKAVITIDSTLQSFKWRPPTLHLWNPIGRTATINSIDIEKGGQILQLCHSGLDPWFDLLTTLSGSVH